MYKDTSIMKQYLKIKSKHKDKLLLFRIGDFYELFYDDALEASKLLSLVLTCRGKSSGSPVPMAGIPCHAINGYIFKLVRAGKKIALCEQMDDYDENNILKRKVIKILTPGTNMEENYLKEGVNNFVCCIYMYNGVYGLSVLDLSTGFFSINHVSNEFDLINELDRINPVEIILSESFNNLSLLPKHSSIYRQKNKKFQYKFAFNVLVGHFGSKVLQEVRIKICKPAIIAGGCLIDFVSYTQKSFLYNITVIDVNCISDLLYMDKNARKDLELFKNLNGGVENTLVDTIDCTLTPMGKRLLRIWLSSPLLSKNILAYRLKGVFILKKNQNYLKFCGVLKEIGDLERIVSRLFFLKIRPIDLKRLSIFLDKIPMLKRELLLLNCDGILKSVFDNIFNFFDLINLIKKYIVDNPSSMIKGGKIIKDGCDSKLDEYRSIYEDVNKYISDFEKKERDRSGILKLKIKCNKNGAYYIEVPINNISMIPSNYRQIKVLINSCRYISDELEELKIKISNCNNNILVREKELYDNIVLKVKNDSFLLQKTAKSIAILDVICSFAKQSSIYNWCEPKFVNNSVINIQAGRHPVLEKVQKRKFIPNYLILCEKKRMSIITGANMSGKSTYMRQSAIIILLSHIGSHVPASSAKIGFVDKIFTRIGSGDNLAKACSTFMLEMNEINVILKYATKSSFILVDEIGRGTSFLEGISLAWAIVNTLINVNKSLVLFSTHFHELFSMGVDLTKINAIYFVTMRDKKRLIFLYEFRHGFSTESFGIHVAELADLPCKVIEDAYKKLDELKEKRKKNLSRTLELKYKEKTMNDIARYISDLDLDNLSSIEALNKLYVLKKMLNNKN